MSITSEYYGRTKDGRDVYRYTLENARGSACVSLSTAAPSPTFCAG